MPETVALNYKVPLATDSNAQVIAALREDIERLSQHTHNGVDAPLDPQAATGVRVEIEEPNWGARQLDDGLFTLQIPPEVHGIADPTDRAFRVYEGLSEVFCESEVENNGTITLKANVPLGTQDRDAELSLLFY